MFCEPTTLTSMIRLLAESLQQDYGVDPRPLFAAAELDISQLETPGARYPLPKTRTLWQLAVTATGDPAIGLKAGQRVRPGSLHALGFAWLASRTLLDALQRLVRYHQVVSTVAVKAILSAEPNHYRLSFEFPDPASRPPPEGVDGAMMAVVQLCRIALERDVRPLRVELCRNPDGHAQVYRNAFGSKVSFRANVDAIHFDRATLEAPLPSHSPEVATATDQVADRYLETMDGTRVASQIRSLLINLLPSGESDAARVARELHLSVSTLQRQLGGEGLTYRDVLDHTRQSLAEAHLREGRLPHTQIAYLLGFSDQSNFSRAFKRWTGRSPSRFQQN
jgi:AraC-like DNA-binding protein